MRVHRCFAFLDLSDFTALTDTQGDEQAVAVLHTFRALLREVCSRRAVRIAKWLGDGAMLVSVETLPVLEAVLEMQFASAGLTSRAGSSGLPGHAGSSDRVVIRAGVTDGLVILYEGDDYIGHAVNLAARLCELAPAGETLGDPGVTGSLPGWGLASEVEEFSVRGLARPVGAARLGLRPLDPPTTPDPVCGIPLTRAVAAAVDRSGLGRELWFCSASCHDTWQRRPAPPPEDHGSVRTPLIGS